MKERKMHGNEASPFCTQGCESTVKPYLAAPKDSSLVIFNFLPILKFLHLKTFSVCKVENLHIKHVPLHPGVLVFMFLRGNKRLYWLKISEFVVPMISSSTEIPSCLCT